MEMGNIGWAFGSMYYLAQVLFILGAVILARSTKRGSAYLSAIGFAAFLGGNVMMIQASKDLVEAQQTQTPAASIERVESVGRALSSSGLIVAAAGFFVFAVGRSRPPIDLPKRSD